MLIVCQEFCCLGLERCTWIQRNKKITYSRYGGKKGVFHWKLTASKEVTEQTEKNSLTNQIKELSEISQTINILFKDAKEIFERQSFDRISLILEQKLRVNQALKLNIDTQVMRTRNEESSPKNTTLYFSLLLETKDLMNAIASLLEQYNSNQLK